MKGLLDNLGELAPIPTDYPSDYKYDPNIKACVFDIYGTLLISSSGDIDLSDVSNEYLMQAFNESGMKMNINNCEDGFCSRVLDYFEDSIKSAHKRAKDKGFPFPEVDIIKIWKKVLDRFIAEGKIEYTQEFNIHRMTSTFEILSNRVYPMPGMKEIIHYLKDLKMPIGIVSNAQFYTPVIMNYFLNNLLSDVEDIELFDPDLSVYSYKAERAKPDTELFSPIVEQLNRYGIKSEEALFVGNDMLKDVYTANARGLKTVLFAGDKRSLRLRENHEKVKGLKADYIINDLLQLKEIIK